MIDWNRLCEIRERANAHRRTAAKLKEMAAQGAFVVGGGFAWPEAADDVLALLDDRDTCDGSCDIALARRQVGPDAIVPGSAKECAELWEQEASRIERERRAEHERRMQEVAAVGEKAETQRKRAEDAEDALSAASRAHEAAMRTQLQVTVTAREALAATVLERNALAAEVERLRAHITEDPATRQIGVLSAQRDVAITRAVKAEAALSEASRVCDKLGCVAAVVRKDDGSRVCAAGHRSRWYDAEDFERVRAARDQFETGYALSSGERDEARIEGDELRLECSAAIHLASDAIGEMRYSAEFVREDVHSRLTAVAHEYTMRLADLIGARGDIVQLAAVARKHLGAALTRQCSACDGDGEVSHGSCGVPDCEHIDTCPTCGGSGETPTAEEIATLRNRCAELEGDRMVLDAEIAAYKERLGALHPFDMAALEAERDAAIADMKAAEQREEDFENWRLSFDVDRDLPLADQVRAAWSRCCDAKEQIATLTAERDAAIAGRNAALEGAHDAGRGSGERETMANQARYRAEAALARLLSEVRTYGDSLVLDIEKDERYIAEPGSIGHGSLKFKNGYLREIAARLRALAGRADSNQCDGCQRGLSVDENGHHHPEGATPFACEAERYRKETP